MSPSADWTTTAVQGGNMLVNFAEPVLDDNWVSAANDTAETWENETRGQAWQSVVFSSDSIHIVGLHDDVAVEQLRAYVADLITAANTEFDERRLRHEQDVASVNDDVEAQREKDEELTERFRDLSD
jgi:hypothetical protein